MSNSRRISAEILQKIKAAINIVEVVGEHVVLRKSGANYVGLCPFHSERTPSFSVTESKQLYHCYGCKKGGDLLSFVMEIHGLDFIEAIEELAERARVSLPAHFRGGVGDAESGDPEVQKRKEEARKKLETSYRLNRFVAAYYHQMLSQSQAASHYFASRGVGDELLRSFYLGVAPPSWDALANYLATKKAPLPLAAELGLIRLSNRGNRVAQNTPPGEAETHYFDLFRNRAIFPILDLRGRVAGFGGRALPGGDENPKYLNSPESPLFQKSKLAFGLYQAQKHIRELDHVILVEGYFDVLALNAAGFQNGVASCGTALSQEHLQLFKKFASRITILFDGDKAGIAATDRAMELGLTQGVILLGAVLPPDADPDEVLFDQASGSPIEGGKDRMETILKEARPLIDVRIDEAILTAQEGPEARTQALKKMGGWLSKLNDPIGKEVRLQYIQNRLGVSRNLLLQAMGESGSGHGPKTNGSPQNIRPFASTVSARPHMLSQKMSPAKVALMNRGEKILLSGLAQGGKLVQIFQAAKNRLPSGCSGSDLFEYLPARNFVSNLLNDVDRIDQILKDPAHLPAELMNENLDPQVRWTVMEAWMGGHEAVQEESFQGALDRAIARIWARFSQRIKAALSEAEVKKDAELQSTLMKEYLDVQRKMKEFISFYDEA